MLEINKKVRSVPDILSRKTEVKEVPEFTPVKADKNATAEQRKQIARENNDNLRETKIAAAKIKRDNTSFRTIERIELPDNAILTQLFEDGTAYVHVPSGEKRGLYWMMQEDLIQE